MIADTIKIVTLRHQYNNKMHTISLIMDKGILNKFYSLAIRGDFSLVNHKSVKIISSLLHKNKKIKTRNK
jgi:uncharacterized protein YkvS